MRNPRTLIHLALVLLVAVLPSRDAAAGQADDARTNIAVLLPALHHDELFWREVLPLQYALMLRNAELAIALLDAGAHPIFDGHLASALTMSIDKGIPEVRDHLLKHGLEPATNLGHDTGSRQEPIFVALMRGDAASVDSLIKYGASPRAIQAEYGNLCTEASIPDDPGIWNSLGICKKQ